MFLVVHTDAGKHLGNNYTPMLQEFSDPMFTRLFLLSEIDNFTAEEYEQYVNSLEDMGDYQNIINTAVEEAVLRGLEKGREEGRVEGRAEGRALGREEGRAEGLAEGLAEGEAAARLEDAHRFKELGVAVDIISQATGLSVETIEGL